MMDVVLFYILKSKVSSTLQPGASDGMTWTARQQLSRRWRSGLVKTIMFSRTKMHRTTTLLVFAILALLGLPAIAFVTSPLRLAPDSAWFFVANLADLPEDGQPRRMFVLAPDRDAWIRRPDKVVGSVFVRRTSDADRALVLEPYHHEEMRVSVIYDKRSRSFQSSCWEVRFDLDGGELLEPGLPPMGDHMPRLPVRVVEGQVFVNWAAR